MSKVMLKHTCTAWLLAFIILLAAGGHSAWAKKDSQEVGAHTLAMQAAQRQLQAALTASRSRSQVTASKSKSQVTTAVASAESDSVEELGNGKIYFNSSDLELGYDGTDQVIGLRFTGLQIPKGATITNSYIQFTSKGASSGVVKFEVSAQQTDNAATFADKIYNVSERTKNSPKIAWNPSDWNTSTAKLNTNNVTALIQPIVNRNGWAPGNAIAFTITETVRGRTYRRAYSNRKSEYAPKLVVEFSTGKTTATSPSDQKVLIKYPIKVSLREPLQVKPIQATVNSQATINRVLQANKQTLIGLGSNSQVVTAVADNQSDSVEELGDGKIYFNSSDLELGYDGTDQVIGLRFTGLQIPKNATITNSYIQFTSKGSSSGAVKFEVSTQQADNANTFANTNNDVSNRTRNAPKLAWNPPNWNTATAKLKTNNLSALIQPIVNRNGWVPGNAIAFTIKETIRNRAYRRAYSNRKSQYAPKLVVEFSTGKTTATSPSDRKVLKKDPIKVSLREPLQVKPIQVKPVQVKPIKATVNSQATINRVLQANQQTLIGLGSNSQVVTAVADNQSDSVEELGDGKIYFNSSDLELGYDGTDQVIGLRFTGLQIPKNATITNSYIQFTSKGSSSGAVKFGVSTQQADNADTFANTNNDVSNRTRNAPKLAWNPPNWNTATAKLKTNNLATLIQPIVNRNGWVPGNAIAFTIKETIRNRAYRRAYSNRNSKYAPKLVVEYSDKTTNWVPTTVKKPIQKPVKGLTSDQILRLSSLANPSVELRETGLARPSAGVDQVRQTIYTVREYDHQVVCPVGQVVSKVVHAQAHDDNGAIQFPTTQGGESSFVGKVFIVCKDAINEGGFTSYRKMGPEAIPTTGRSGSFIGGCPSSYASGLSSTFDRLLVENQRGETVLTATAATCKGDSTTQTPITSQCPDGYAVTGVGIDTKTIDGKEWFIADTGVICTPTSSPALSLFDFYSGDAAGNIDWSRVTNHVGQLPNDDDSIAGPSTPFQCPDDQFIVGISVGITAHSHRSSGADTSIDQVGFRCATILPNGDVKNERPVKWFYGRNFVTSRNTGASLGLGEDDDETSRGQRQNYELNCNRFTTGYLKVTDKNSGNPITDFKKWCGKQSVDTKKASIEEHAKALQKQYNSSAYNLGFLECPPGQAMVGAKPYFSTHAGQLSHASIICASIITKKIGQNAFHCLLGENKANTCGLDQPGYQLMSENWALAKTIYEGILPAEEGYLSYTLDDVANASHQLATGQTSCGELVDNLALATFNSPDDYYHLCPISEDTQRLYNLLEKTCPNGVDACPLLSPHTLLVDPRYFKPKKISRGFLGIRNLLGIGAKVEANEAHCLVKGNTRASQPCYIGADKDQQADFKLNPNVLLQTKLDGIGDVDFSSAKPSFLYADYYYEQSQRQEGGGIRQIGQCAVTFGGLFGGGCRVDGFTAYDHHSGHRPVLISPTPRKDHKFASYSSSGDDELGDHEIANSLPNYTAFQAIHMFRHECWAELEADQAPWVTDSIKLTPRDTVEFWGLTVDPGASGWANYFGDVNFPCEGVAHNGMETKKGLLIKGKAFPTYRSKSSTRMVENFPVYDVRDVFDTYKTRSKPLNTIAVPCSPPEIYALWGDYLNGETDVLKASENSYLDKVNCGLDAAGFEALMNALVADERRQEEVLQTYVDFAMIAATFGYGAARSGQLAFKAGLRTTFKQALRTILRSSIKSGFKTAFRVEALHSITSALAYVWVVGAEQIPACYGGTSTTTGASNKFVKLQGYNENAGNSANPHQCLMASLNGALLVVALSALDLDEVNAVAKAIPNVVGRKLSGAVDGFRSGLNTAQINRVIGDLGNLLNLKNLQGASARKVLTDVKIVRAKINRLRKSSKPNAGGKPSPRGTQIERANQFKLVLSDSNAAKAAKPAIDGTPSAEVVRRQLVVDVQNFLSNSNVAWSGLSHMRPWGTQLIELIENAPTALFKLEGFWKKMRNNLDLLQAQYYAPGTATKFLQDVSDLSDAVSGVSFKYNDFTNTKFKRDLEEILNDVDLNTLEKTSRLQDIDNFYLKRELLDSETLDALDGLLENPDLSLAQKSRLRQKIGEMPDQSASIVPFINGLKGRIGTGNVADVVSYVDEWNYVVDMAKERGATRGDFADPDFITDLYFLGEANLPRKEKAGWFDQLWEARTTCRAL